MMLSKNSYLRFPMKWDDENIARIMDSIIDSISHLTRTVTLYTRVRDNIMANQRRVIAISIPCLKVFYPKVWAGSTLTFALAPFCRKGCDKFNINVDV